MKVAYLDCFSGISGDMALGAFIDAGLSPEDLTAELRKLGITGWELSARKVDKQHIVATKVDITCSEQEHHRHYTDIVKMIKKRSVEIDDFESDTI